MVEWMRLSSDFDFVIYDLETTGFSVRSAQIIEIGALAISFRAERRQFVVTDSFQTLVQLYRNFPARIETLTGITRDMLENDGLPLPDALSKFRRFVGDRQMVAYNAIFDDSFTHTALQLTAERAAGGIVPAVEAFPLPSTCAMMLARRAWPDLRSYRLAELAETLKAPEYVQHRALADCMRTLYVMGNALARLEEVGQFSPNDEPRGTRDRHAGQDDSLWSSVRGTQPVGPATKLPVDTEFDDTEHEGARENGARSAAPDWMADMVSGQDVVITYRDTTGKVTSRHVQCRRISSEGGIGHLHAFCMLRQASRSFRIDRIVAVTAANHAHASQDVSESGKEFFDRLTTGVGTSSTYGLTQDQYISINAALNVLVFISCCDGHWHPLEKEALERFVMAWWLRHEIVADLDLDSVARHASGLTPDAEVFWVSLQRCSGDRITASIIRHHIAATIDADGIHHPNELDWGRRIVGFLDSIEAPVNFDRSQSSTHPNILD